MVIDIVLGFAEGRGGLETVLTLITQELYKRGYRVRVFQAAPPTYIDWEKTIPEIYYYCAYDNPKLAEEVKIKIVKYTVGYKNLLEKLGEPDVVIATHTPLFSLVCKLALEKTAANHVPIISWLHGPPEAYGGGDLLKLSHSHLAISKSIGKKIEQYVTNKSRIYYIGNPLDLNAIKPLPRSKKGLELLYIGRLNNHEKRLDVLFRGLCRLRGNWQLKIIGDGPDRNLLFQLAHSLGIAEHIDWLGWKDDPWNSVSEASLLLLSSDYEGFGMVIVEALARGIPVVSTDCDGPSEIIQDGINGWLYPKRDSDALRTILQDILDGRRSLPIEMRCRESIRRFDIEQVVDRFEEAILKTLETYRL